MVEGITRGSIEMSWDARARLAFLRFTSETHARGADAVALVAAMERWIGTDGASFGLLGDGARLARVDAEYRSSWGRFFRRHRADAGIAFFNMGPFIRVAAEMFRIGTRVRLKAFAGEPEARAWLREMGIRA